MPKKNEQIKGLWIILIQQGYQFNNVTKSLKVIYFCVVHTLILLSINEDILTKYYY